LVHIGELLDVKAGLAACVLAQLTEYGSILTRISRGYEKALLGAVILPNAPRQNCSGLL
jgi:hypothetical protein